MEQLFGNVDLSRAMAQRECLLNADASMEQLQQNLQGKSPREQREYLERHHRDALERFGDLLRPFNILSRETDAQAVNRLLNDVRSEQTNRCSRIR